MKRTTLIVFALAAACLASADFGKGNLVLTRVGDGSAGLSSAATPTFLDEIQTNGTFVRSLPLPTTVNGSSRRHTNSGSSTSEGGLQRSTDKKFLSLMGYDADPGTTAIAATRSADVNRIVTLVDAQDAVDTTTALTDAYDGSNPRSAITLDGTKIWTAGTAGSGNFATGGIRFTTRGSNTSVQLASTPTNTRVVSIYNGNLYFTTMSGSFIGVNTIPGLPETSGQTATQLPGFPPAGSTESPYDFYFANDTTLYVASDASIANGGGIEKWTYDSGTMVWSLAYVMNGGRTAGVRRLVGTTDSLGETTLYVIGSEAATPVLSVVDTGSSSTFNQIASPGTNTAFRGIAFAPEAADNGPVDVFPSAITIFRGALISGGIAELMASDDQYLVVRNGPIAFPTESPITVIFDGTYSGNTRTAVTLTVENKVSIGNLSQTIDMFNFTTNSYDATAVDTRPAPTTDTVVTIVGTGDINRFFGTGGALRARLRVRPAGPLFTNNWRSSTDLVKWTVTP